MIIPNAEAAPVVANVLILPLSFISGIWYPLTGAPDWLVDVANVFPVARLANACTSPSTRSTTARRGRATTSSCWPSGCWWARAWRCASGSGRWRAERAVPDRFRVPAARVAGIFAVFISLPAVIGLLGDEPSAGRVAAVAAALVVFFAFFFQAVRGPVAPRPPPSSRAPTSSTWSSRAR
jgi:hypothetical protein